MGGNTQGSARTPYEAPDSLKSAQRLRAIGLISLGPIKGPVNKWKSTYFDNTPIQNENGVDDNDEASFNFKNTEVSFTLGTQDQAPLQGFEMSEREVPVSTEVKYTTPITRTVTDPDVTRLRVTLGVNALYEQNDQGDTNGTSVWFRILINGSPRGTYEINGKSSSRFYRSYIVDNLPERPFTITVERTTTDSKSQRLQNATNWVSYTEIIDTKLSYPNMALVGIKTDSRYNPNFPNVNFLLYGRLVKVPSTYDPEARTYATALWKGDWKQAWTNNPAWVFYDLVTDPLAGLGKRVGDYGLDKFQLYQIAKYCDELVDDGYGGKEPRMTANLWLTDQRSAYDVLADMASVFRAITVWNGIQFTAIQDRTADPVCTYSQANVIGGKFVRQYAAMKSIYTAVEVEYADERNMYQKAIEYVADDAMIERYGYNVKKITAYATTSRGQAHRLGKWVLATSLLEQCTITFSVGRQGLRHLPGDIIEVADNHYASKVLGGRVVAINDNKVTLDQPIEMTGESYLSWLNDEMKLTKVKITQVDATNKAIVTLASDPIGLAVMSDWVLKTPTVSTQLYRAIGITENDDGSYTITALQHEPQKEAIVDESAIFEPLPATTHYSLLPVTSPEIGVDGSGVILNFSAPTFVGQGLRYQVKLFRNGKFYQLYDDLKEPNLAFANLPNGDYVAEIRAKDGQGRLSDAVSKTFNINFSVSELVTVSKVLGIGLAWKNPLFAPTNSAIEIWASKQNRFETARKLVSLAYPTNSYTYDGLGIAETYYFWARMVDNLNGTAGEFTPMTEGITERSAEKLVDYLEGQITESTLGQDLIQSLQNNVDSSVALEAQARAAAISAEANARIQMVNGVNANVTAERNRIASAIQDIGVLQAANNAKTQEMANLTQTVGRQTSSVQELGVTTGQLAQQYGQLKSVTDNVTSEITTIKQTQSNQANSVERLTSRFDNVMSSQNLLSDTLNKTTTAFLLGVYPIGRTLSEGQKVIIKATTAPAQRVLIYNSSPRGVNRIGEIMADGTPNELDWVVGNAGNNNLHVYRTSVQDSATITLSDVSLTLPDGALADVVAEVSEHKRTVATQTQALTAKTTLLESNLAGKANVSALSSLDSRVTQVDGRITSEARKVEQLTNQLIGKANVSALSSLDSRVTQVDGRITSEARKVEQLTNQLIGKANVSALSSLDSRVTQVDGRITSEARKVEQLTNQLIGKANVSALSSLDSRVTQVDGRITSEARKVEQLTNQLIGKANVSALSSLDSRVTQVDGRITSEARKVEQLTNQLIGKANVSAVSNLESRVNRYGSQIQRFDQITNDFNNQGRMLRGQISTLSNTVANLQNNEVRSTHTIKTEAISGGRTAIAGISLGASANARTVESSVIIMANKFAVVKNASDSQVVPMFSVADNKVALNGDLISNGTILGRHLKANEMIESPVIQGGIIRGTRIEGVTGTFTGNVYAENILNDVVEYKKINMLSYDKQYKDRLEEYQEYKKNNHFIIKPSIKKRVLYLPPTNFTILPSKNEKGEVIYRKRKTGSWTGGVAHQGAFIDFSTGLSTRVADNYSEEKIVGIGVQPGKVFNYRGVTDIWDIPANTEVTVTIRAEHDDDYITGLFIFLILS
ncbi:phage tail protein [Mannheimia pernigra]|uniref:DUF1983 domain-containing protein n=1 Tax=Mannheimia pernigra TaxID=111844 RepID=A0A7D5DYD8_9PAST|nr:phage tail protein [Mannheimia pernigra]QLB40785.1 DUF1983 domain-containing protein [Mannheimia pernigra]